MKAKGLQSVSKLMIACEFITTASIIAIIWLNEIIDIPHLLLGAEPTPLNWRESVFESIIIAFLGTVIFVFTNKIFLRMKFLEGVLPVCASCKRIRDDKGHWHQIESYIRDRSEAEFTHGVCPECAKKLYSNVNLSEKE